MCKLKLPFPLTLPPRGNPARLPALLVPVLVLAAVIQIALPDAAALPPAGAVGRATATAVPQQQDPITVPPVLVQRGLFSPAAGGGTSAASAPEDPLGGIVFAGTVQQGSVRYALVHMPDGRIIRLATGGQVRGWHLLELSPQGARIRRARTVMTVKYGQHAVLTPTPNAHAQSEDEQ